MLFLAYESTLGHCHIKKKTLKKLIDLLAGLCGNSDVDMKHFTINLCLTSPISSRQTSEYFRVREAAHLV